MTVIYARYSSDRQTEQSIDGQIHVCMEYAERNDIVIVGTYIDRAMTGTNDNREQFQKMLKDSDKKPFDYVLVLIQVGGFADRAADAAPSPSALRAFGRRDKHTPFHRLTPQTASPRQNAARARGSRR